MSTPTDLDEFLNPKDAPMALSKDVVDPYTFDMNNERNTVGQNQIRDFSFSSGRGGTLTLGGSAGVLVVDSTAAENSNSFIYPVFFKLDGVTVSQLNYRRYTPGTTEVTDFRSRSVASTASSRITYNTLDIYDNAGTNRLGFMQIGILENGGTITQASLTLGFGGITALSIVKKGTATYDETYMTLPIGSADSALAPNGSMYYDATTGKIRAKHASGWADV